MSIRTSHPPVLMQQETSSGQNNMATDDGTKGVVTSVMEEDHEKPQETATILAQISSLQKSSNDQSTMADTQPDLLSHPWLNHEEASVTGGALIKSSSRDNKVKLKSAEILVDEDAVDVDQAEIKPQLAIAIPILVLGRPKLIDITNLAPMHKRKRSIAKSIPMPAVKKVATQASLRNNDNRRSVSFHEDAPQPKQQPPPDSQTRLKRKENFARTTAPVSWFPEVSPPTEEEEKQFRHELYMVPIPRPVDHDAISLSSSRLSKFSKHSGRQITEMKSPVPPRTSSIPKSPVTPRSPLTPKSPSTPGWKGLSRSISMIRRQSVNLEPDQPQQSQQQQQTPLNLSHQPAKSVPKKPKMIPRPADERADGPIIPPFTFEPHLVMV